MQSCFLMIQLYRQELLNHLPTLSAVQTDRVVQSWFKPARKTRQKYWKPISIGKTQMTTTFEISPNWIFWFLKTKMPTLFSTAESLYPVHFYIWKHLASLILTCANQNNLLLDSPYIGKKMLGWYLPEPGSDYQLWC